MSRIEQIIDEIEEFIEECKPAPLSKTKITVEKDELMELVTELREEVPSEIKQYQKIISNQEAILTDAKNQANNMMAEANRMTKQLTDEHEIMQKAYANANIVMEEARVHAQQVVDNAYAEAENIRNQIMHYIDDLLGSVSSNLQYSMQDAQGRFEQLMNTLGVTVNNIEQNREQIASSFTAQEEEEAVIQQEIELQ